MNLLHLVLVHLVLLLSRLFQLLFQLFTLGSQFSLNSTLLVLRGPKATLQLLNLLSNIFLLSFQLALFKVKVALLFVHEDSQVLYLSLLSSDGFYQFSLILKVGVAYQLRVIHLDHLQFLSCGEFLLDESVTLSCMCLLNLIDLTHEPFLILCGLSGSNLLCLISKLKHLLRMIRLQLLFIVSEIFDLLLVLFDLHFESTLTSLLLQHSDLFLRLAFFLSHLGVKQLLLQELHLILVVDFSLLHICNKLLLLLEFFFQS